MTVAVGLGAGASAGESICFWSAAANSGLGGKRVLTLSDFDGDGWPDVVVPDPLDNTSGPLAGVVRLYSLAQCGSPVWTLTGSAPGDFLGVPADLGDVDGDGVSDLVLSASGDDTLAFDGGRVELRRGTAGSLGWVYFGSLPQAALSVLDAAGDVNADGVVDVLVGAPSHSSGLLLVGWAAVLDGVTGGPLLVLPGPGGHSEFGMDGAGVGDIDGDGHDDVAVSAPLEGFPNVHGRVEVFSGQTGAVLWAWLGSPDGTQAGTSVERAGDVDGDGIDEILVTTVAASPVGGQLHVLDVANGVVEGVFAGVTPLQTFSGGAGDLDGDGRSDFAMVPVSGDLEFQRWQDPAPLCRLDAVKIWGQGDVNADGFGDYAALRSGGASSVSELRLYSGRCDGVDPFGTGCPGGQAEPPRLFLFGPCDLRSNQTLTLLVDGTAPGGVGLLLFGQGPANVPVGSCVLHVSPLLGPAVPFVTDAAGAGAVNFVIPPGLTGLSAHMQAFTSDASSPDGFAATNGLTLTFP